MIVLNEKSHLTYDQVHNAIIAAHKDVDTKLFPGHSADAKRVHDLLDDIRMKLLGRAAENQAEADAHDFLKRTGAAAAAAAEEAGVPDAYQQHLARNAARARSGG